VSRSISAPVVKLENLFRGQYGSPDGVARGGRTDMHWVSVHEYRSSQTCSRCYDARGLKQHRKGRFKLKQCAHGEAVLPPDRLQAQLHDVVLGEDDHYDKARRRYARCSRLFTAAKRYMQLQIAMK
jgi:hypothetical protein